MTIAWVAIIAFGLAALGGLTMLGLRLKGRTPPVPLAVLHGLGAATGLVCLLLTVTSGHAARFATYALVGFGAAALGGVYLLSMHLRGKIHPVPLILVHGSIAITSFVLLLLAVLR